MKCLIVAAGQGTRLRERFELKPLTPVCGMKLIEHAIGRARHAGAGEFLVVSGYRGEELRQELDAIAVRRQVRVTHVVNDDWQRANGVSVLKAKPHLDEPFLLAMCDHLADPDILLDLMSVPPEPGSVTLAVDFAIDKPYIDPDDVTRVLCAAGRISRIGKLIDDFNCFDTGFFLCTPAVFDALERSQARGDDSISGAMTVLAELGKARAFDIGGRTWIDVDDPASLRNAEALLDSGRL